MADSKAPVRILVGFPVSGGLDVTARILAESMSQVLEQPFMVENRPGAGGMLAAQALKAAKPDGNTLLITNDHTVAILPHTVKNPGFETARDFAPVALLSDRVAFALATNSGTRITHLKEITEWARQNPGKSNIGIPAPRSMFEFAVGLLSKELQFDAAAAAYRGGAPVVMDLASGQIPFGISSPFELLPFAKNQKVRILAVSGTSRHRYLPDVPTFSELGVKGFETTNIVGIYAPAGTPPDLIARYSNAVRVALASEKVKERMHTLGASPNYGSAEALAKGMQRISDTWGPVIRQSGHQPE
ncbi:tripartite tricarboxylate transporter substrate-binding protein [Acidovorax sp. D2M1]|uniref:Tripartite tricarboxylate transporter substrate-binding protein n=2 Tax=Acidovorax benzenivorans TaxID=2987520 RepID=A0ABT5S3Z7_9BURK|nr:tripartite tricarboxylate transporter substrate-binding protein [Acidovorax benzenivorans]